MAPLGNAAIIKTKNETQKVSILSKVKQSILIICDTRELERLPFSYLYVCTWLRGGGLCRLRVSGFFFRCLQRLVFRVL